MILPFETDELALLEACAMALAALSSDRTHFASQPFRQMVFKRLPGEAAVMEPTAHDTETERLLLSAAYPMAGEALSVEALSRSIERDARRFGS